MITAEEALARVQAAGIADTLTSHIDQAILVNANKGWPERLVWPVHGPVAVLDVLVERYRAVGWIAFGDISDNERDVPCLVLDLSKAL